MKTSCPICRSQLENAEYEECGQCEISIRSYSRLLVYQTNLFNLGLIAANNKEFLKAYEYFAAVVHWCPEDINARNALAMACYELGRNARARFHWERLLERSPDDPIAKQGIVALDIKARRIKQKTKQKKTSKKGRRKKKRR